MSGTCQGEVTEINYAYPCIFLSGADTLVFYSIVTVINIQINILVCKRCFGLLLGMRDISDGLFMILCFIFKKKKVK